MASSISSEAINKRLSDDLESAKSDIESLKNIIANKDKEIKEASKWKEQFQTLREEKDALQQTLIEKEQSLEKAKQLISLARSNIDSSKQLAAANEQLKKKLEEQEKLSQERLNEIQSLKVQLESLRDEKNRLQEEKLEYEKQTQTKQQEQNARLVKQIADYQELIELRDKLAEENRRLRELTPVVPIPGDNFADEAQEQMKKEISQKDEEIRRLQYQLDQTRLRLEERLDQAQRTAADLGVRIREQEDRYHALQEANAAERMLQQQSPIGSFISIIPSIDKGDGQPTVIVNSRGPTLARITERAAQSSLQRLKERVEDYRRSAAELIRNRDTANENSRYVATQLNAIQMLLMQDYGGEIVDRQSAEGTITWRFKIAEDGLQAARELPTIGFSDVRVLDISPSERGRLIQVKTLGSNADISLRYSTSMLTREIRSINEEQIIEKANRELDGNTRDARQRAIRVIGESLQSSGIIYADNGNSIAEMLFSTVDVARRASFLLNRTGVPTRPIQTDLDSGSFRVIIGK